MNLLLLSFKEAFCILFKTNFVFGSVGSVLAIFFIGRNCLGCDIQTSFVIGLFLYLMIYMCISTYRVWENGKAWYTAHFFDNIWGEAIVLVKEIEDSVRKYEANVTQADIVLRDVCNKTKKYFDKKTKDVSAVSIKVPVESDDSIDNMVVENIARDDSSAKKRNTEAYRSITHTIFDNTAYIVIFSRLRKKKSNAYYMNNDINKDANYETTSRDAYDEGVLPYNSEFVFPIISLPTEKYKSSTDLVGFFCIDCEGRRKFTDDKYSVNLMKAICNSLCRIIQS